MKTLSKKQIDKDNCLIDVSNSERGVKVYATKNGYDRVGYRIGYNAFTMEQLIIELQANRVNLN